MQNTIQKFRQSPIAFEKPGILSENLKTLTNYPTVKYFLRKLFTFSTYECLQKGCGIFFKKSGFYTLVFNTY